MFLSDFLRWTFNYLTYRLHFYQTDSNISNLLITNFCVPQGLILEPVLSSICVTGMTTIFSESQCIQYAGDTRIYCSCKVKGFKKCSSGHKVTNVTMVTKYKFSF